LARQGVQPLTYALDRALGFRASPSTRALLHELGQRLFPVMPADPPDPVQQSHTP